MDPTTAAGIAVLVTKLGLFALLVHASRRASRAVREAEAARAAPDPGARQAIHAPSPAPLREAA